MKITIVIPCYNESDSLPELIKNLSEIKNDFQFLIVDNGSTDNTQETINKLSIPENIELVRKKKNNGYGAGIKYGLSKVNTEYAGWMHGDLQQNPKVLLKAKQLIDSLSEKERGELIALKGLRSGRSIFDNLFTTGVSIFSSILFFNSFRDIAGQPNIFKTSSLKFIENAPDDHSFEFFTYVKFVKNKGTFKRFHAPFYKRKYGASSWDKGIISKLKHSQFIFKYLLNLRLNL